MGRILAYVTCAALIASGWGLWLRERDERMVETGRLREVVRGQDSVLAVLRRGEVPIQQRLERDTVYVRQRVHVQRVLRDTVLQWMRDTVAVHDTTVIVRYVRGTDSTIQACTQALSACVALAENRKKQIQSLELKVSHVVPKAESQLSQFLHKALLVGGGLGVGYLLSEARK